MVRIVVCFAIVVDRIDQYYKRKWSQHWHLVMHCATTMCYPLAQGEMLITNRYVHGKVCDCESLQLRQFVEQINTIYIVHETHYSHVFVT